MIDKIGEFINKPKSKVKYTYFITYIFNKNNNIGLGRVEITTNNKITKIEKIFQLENVLKKKNSFDTITILNYSLLRKENEETK